MVKYKSTCKHLQVCLILGIDRDRQECMLFSNNVCMDITAPSNEIPLFHCTKESMKYLASIIVYWTNSTSGPVFLLERSGNFTYYCCCTCLLVFQ